MPHTTTYQGEIYCVECSAPHEVTATVQTNGKGQHFAESTCPRKGTPIRRLLTPGTKPAAKPTLAA